MNDEDRKYVDEHYTKWVVLLILLPFTVCCVGQLIVSWLSWLFGG